MGLIIACKIATLNQFMVASIPAEILIVVPAVLWMFWFKSGWLVLHPGISMLKLCANDGDTLVALLALLFWTVLSVVLATKTVAKMLKSVGGIKL